MSDARRCGHAARDGNEAVRRLERVRGAGEGIGGLALVAVRERDYAEVRAPGVARTGSHTHAGMWHDEPRSAET